jgi:hypothetical protein
MEGKLTAVYPMARKEELTQEDGGSYGRLLSKQKQACPQLLKDKFSEEDRGAVELYTSRGQLLMDVERLGAHPGDIEGILFELRAQGIEVLTVTQWKLQPAGSTPQKKTAQEQVGGCS